MALNDLDKMISKTHVREAFEKCSLCGQPVPHGRLILRHRITQKILCVLCMMHLAEVE